METFLIIMITTIVLFALVGIFGPKPTDEEMATFKYGAKNPALVCPHCQVKGQIRTKAVKNKKGISGAKATGALLTGGISMLATGLSRKEAQTAARCENCNSDWHF